MEVRNRAQLQQELNQPGVATAAEFVIVNTPTAAGKPLLTGQEHPIPTVPITKGWVTISHHSSIPNT